MNRPQDAVPRFDAAQLDALRLGRSARAFDLLGLHPSQDGWQVSAFFPDAAALWVLPETGKAISARALGGGVFLADLAQREGYRLRVEQAGQVWEQDDPYRFGPVLGPMDEYLISEGRHQKLWLVLGGHLIDHEGVAGAHFAVWAPHAARVSVVGDWNGWDGRRQMMRKRGASGVWEIFIPDLQEGAHYAYELLDANGQILPLKADPFGFAASPPPAKASILQRLDFDRADTAWLEQRHAKQDINAPISIYEVHAGSWRRGEGDRTLSYRDLAGQLIEYVADMGFTHIEFLPLSEHPFSGSWGYQPLGLYAPTQRFGTPQDFAALVDAAHAKGIGILLDWVPGHFPTDDHGLREFDGTALYEHSDPREGFHQDWNTAIFNFGRREVQNYLTANARYWLEEYHIDGLRVDAVASMLYRDYSRAQGEWVPNKDGGRENYEAIAFLQDMNVQAYTAAPGIMTVAEESTSYDGVSRPVERGGLGFGFKWNMGWMNDSLAYMARDPIYRSHHHNQMTFGITYAWTENFVLPISHDEVVHGKGSMLGKMAGEGDDKFANLRAFYGYMWGYPGKKLLFMGQEFAQGREWNHDFSLDWHLLDHPLHRGMQAWVRDLNRLYRATPALHLNDCRPEGFRWINADDAAQSVFSWLRMGRDCDPVVAVVTNMTPVERRYRIGLPHAGQWREALNSDATVYGGQNRGNFGRITTESYPAHGHAQSAEITLPPLTSIIFVQEDVGA